MSESNRIARPAALRLAAAALLAISLLAMGMDIYAQVRCVEHARAESAVRIDSVDLSSRAECDAGPPARAPAPAPCRRARCGRRVSRAR